MLHWLIGQNRLRGLHRGFRVICKIIMEINGNTFGIKKTKKGTIKMF